MAYWRVLARLLSPGISLLGMVRLAGNCADVGLLGWERSFTEEDLYANGQWLKSRHGLIERRLWQARPSVSTEQVFLYDVTSSYMEGDCNSLAAFGYNRDRKKGGKQVVVGLLTDSEGEPIFVQVYRGNTNDLKTLGRQVDKIRRQFGCRGVMLVRNGGMIRSEQKTAVGGSVAAAGGERGGRSAVTGPALRDRIGSPG